MNASFIAPAMSCGGCARNVKAALGSMAGVSEVNVDVAAKRVTVRYDEAAIAPDELAAALTEAGYPPEPQQASR
jgi:copper chaperone CopZ